MIGRDESIFIKTMFAVKESHAKMPHKLKTHVRDATSAKLTPVCPFVNAVDEKGTFELHNQL